MIFRILPAAEFEAALAAAWYDDQRPGLGDEFLSELANAQVRINLAPLALPRFEGYRGRHEIRRCLLLRFLYAVSYVCRPGQVIVVAVSHLRRRPFYWLDRLG